MEQHTPRAAAHAAMRALEADLADAPMHELVAAYATIVELVLLHQPEALWDALVRYHTLSRPADDDASRSAVNAPESPERSAGS